MWRIIQTPCGETRLFKLFVLNSRRSFQQFHQNQIKLDLMLPLISNRKWLLYICIYIYSWVHREVTCWPAESSDGRRTQSVTATWSWERAAAESRGALTWRSASCSRSNHEAALSPRNHQSGFIPRIFGNICILAQRITKSVRHFSSEL